MKKETDKKAQERKEGFANWMANTVKSVHYANSLAMSRAYESFDKK